MTSKSTKKDYKALYDALKTEHDLVLKKSTIVLKDALKRLEAKDAEIAKVKAQLKAKDDELNDANREIHLASNCAKYFKEQFKAKEEELAKYKEAEKAYKTKFSLEETRLTSQEMKETERRAREDEADEDEADEDEADEDEADEEPTGMFARLYKNKTMSLEDFDYYEEFMDSKDRKCLLKYCEGQDESDQYMDLELIQLYVKSENSRVGRYVLLMVFEQKYTICTYVNTNSCLDITVSNNYFEDDCHKGEGDDEGDEEVVTSIENLLTHIPANCHKGVRKIWEENM